MYKLFLRYLPILILSLWTNMLIGQESPSYRKTAFAVDVTRSLINELNFSIERFSSSRRSIEFYGGLIYVNDFLEERAEDWTTADLFSEHGYTGRIRFKSFKRQPDNSRWRDYIAPGIVYKHLYYNEQWFEDLNSTDTIKSIYQRRDRDKFGVEFTWGKIYEMSKTLTLEFYYGAGIMLTSVNRRIYKVETEDTGEIIDYFSSTKLFYARPVLQIGLKLRIRV